MMNARALLCWTGEVQPACARKTSALIASAMQHLLTRSSCRMLCLQLELQRHVRLKWDLGSQKLRVVVPILHRVRILVVRIAGGARVRARIGCLSKRQRRICAETSAIPCISSLVARIEEA